LKKAVGQMLAFCGNGDQHASEGCAP